MRFLFLYFLFCLVFLFFFVSVFLLLLMCGASCHEVPILVALLEELRGSFFFKRKGWIQATFVSKCKLSRLTIGFSVRQQRTVAGESFLYLINKIVALHVGLIIDSRLLLSQKNKNELYFTTPWLRTFAVAIFVPRTLNGIFFISLFHVLRFSSALGKLHYNCVFAVLSKMAFMCFRVQLYRDFAAAISLMFLFWKNFHWTLLLFLYFFLTATVSSTCMTITIQHCKSVESMTITVI